MRRMSRRWLSRRMRSRMRRSDIGNPRWRPSGGDEDGSTSQ